MGNRPMESSSRLTSEKTITFPELIDTIYLLMKAVWGDDSPVFTMIKPDATNSKNVPMPQIVYSLVKRQPGIVGNRQTREIKPRVREQKTEISPLTNKEVQVSYLSQMQDCNLDFIIYASSNDEAFHWTEKLRFFIDEYKGYLMGQGVSEFIWLEESERNTRESSKEAFSSRGISYLVRIEEIKRIEQPTLEEINLYISTSRSELESMGELPSQYIHYRLNKNKSEEQESEKGGN